MPPSAVSPPHPHNSVPWATLPMLKLFHRRRAVRLRYEPSCGLHAAAGFVQHAVLKEVVRHTRDEIRNLALQHWPRVVDSEIELARRVNRHDGGDIPTPIAVVRRRPYGDKEPIKKVLEPVHGQLV